MYANVCVLHRNIYLWPPVAIRKITTACREGPGWFGDGGCWGGGSAAVSVGWVPVSTFLLGSVPSESTMGEGRGALCPSLLLHPHCPPPSGFSESPICFLPILALFLEHLIGDARPPLCPAPGAWSLQSCVQVGWWEGDS